MCRRRPPTPAPANPPTDRPGSANWLARVSGRYPIEDAVPRFPARSPHHMSVRIRHLAALLLAATSSLSAQAAVTETRDPRQRMDADFEKVYKEWTRDPKYGSPLVDHLPIVPGIP